MLLQELRAKQGSEAKSPADQQQELRRLTDTVVQQRELIQQLRAQQVQCLPSKFTS
jgi:hypothetical protein